MTLDRPSRAKDSSQESWQNAAALAGTLCQNDVHDQRLATQSMSPMDIDRPMTAQSFLLSAGDRQIFAAPSNDGQDARPLLARAMQMPQALFASQDRNLFAAPTERSVPFFAAPDLNRVAGDVINPALQTDRDIISTPNDKLQRLTDANGQFAGLSKGPDSYHIERDQAGNIVRISENIAGKSNVYEVGKDFSQAQVQPDGSLKLISPDGQVSHTITTNLDAVDRIIGNNPDGSNDTIIHVQTAEGVERSFELGRFDPQTGRYEINKITDKLQTNNGVLVEETSRIGGTDRWTFTTNYGKSGVRTGVDVDTVSGDVRSKEVTSKPNDLVTTDNSAALHSNVQAARAHLVEIGKAHKLFGGSEAQTEKWAKEFEQRCRSYAHRGFKSPTDEQICKTYNYLERILTDGKKISETEKRAMVESALRTFADPRHHVNQGSHPSCAFASVFRHIVTVKPEEMARTVFEAVSTGKIRSHAKSGIKKTLSLTDQQISLNDKESKDNVDGKGFGWNYFNKVGQIALIDLGYHGRYKGNGHGFPGGSEDQQHFANKFVTGEKKMLGSSIPHDKGSFLRVQKALKEHGPLRTYWPGHALTITDAKVVNGVAYVFRDNTWNGSQEGWIRCCNV